MTGQTLGPFRVLEKIGSGGMGEVFRAEDTRLGRPIALKLVGQRLAGDPKAAERLREEARIASTLNHPHVCTIYEVGESEGLAYIAMEYVEGQPLSSLVAGGLPLERALTYATQISDALADAHEHDILHRDLKSSNVVITAGTKAKVLDFGLARRLADAEVNDMTQSRASLAEAGGMVGTLHYIAPEVLRGKAADARSDIWSFGVMLYEMVAGEMPFRGQTGYEVTSAILYEPPLPLPARLPAALRALIQRCLAKEPEQRYQSAREVNTALEALRVEVTGATPKPRTRRSRKMLYQARTNLRAQWKGLLILGAGMVGGGVGGLLLAGAGQEFRVFPVTTVDWLRLLRFPVIVLGASLLATSLVALHLKRWSFLIYPNKIRVQGKRRPIDILFAEVQGVELVGYQVNYLNPVSSTWWELKLGADPRYPKLGEVGAVQTKGLRQVVRIATKKAGWRRGYYLDVDQPQRFFDALNTALQRYRAEGKSPSRSEQKET